MNKNKKSKIVLFSVIGLAAVSIGTVGFATWMVGVQKTNDVLTVTANVGVHSLIVNGVEKNSIKYHVESAQVGGSFVEKTNTTSTSLTQNYSDVWSGYSVDHSYNFRVRVGDVFGFGGWSVGVIPTGIVTQQWSSKTTSFGKMIDDTRYNIQVGTGGIQSDGPIVDKNGNEVGFESGSNPDGTYLKFSDGTLIMTVTSNATLAWSKAVTATVNMPVLAINTNYQVQLSYAYDLPDAIRGKTTVHARNKTTSSFGIVMQTQDEFFNATNAEDVRIDCVIYARWK